MCQSTWIYDRAIDTDGLHRFHQSLGCGLLGRRIERSPLPFGRHRWVTCGDPPDIEFATSVRSRAEIDAWIDERAAVPVDPEFGPSWHLGVLSLADGGTAVSLVASHCVVDGLGLTIAIAEAVKGAARQFGYPPPGSRTRVRALLVDAGEVIRGLPEIVRALIATLFLLLRLLFEPSRPSTSPPSAATEPDDEQQIVLPAVTIYVDMAAWDARARSLTGTSNSLFVAFGARLADRMGRVHPGDGTVTITLPVSERTPDDTRANALTSINLRVDPGQVTTDLQAIRDQVKRGLCALRETPNELMAPLPLIPMVPKWLARNMEGLAMGSTDLPVGCSNLGPLEPAISRPDGTDADFVSLRLADQGVTTQSIERVYGQLFLGSGRINERVFITVVAYERGIDDPKKSSAGVDPADPCRLQVGRHDPSVNRANSSGTGDI